LFCSNVFGGERAGAFANLFGPGNGTFEADDRELGLDEDAIDLFEVRNAGLVAHRFDAGTRGGAAFVSMERTLQNGHNSLQTVRNRCR
jgi:hypothetical protein